VSERPACSHDLSGKTRKTATEKKTFLSTQVAKKEKNKQME
jgi:hypothetical protein